MEFFYVVGDHLHNAKDGNREQQTPEPTRKSNAIHTDTVFIFAIWMGFEVTMNTTITHECCGQYLEM